MIRRKPSSVSSSIFLFSTRRLMATTCPLPVESQIHSVSTSAANHKSHCLSLLDQLISRGLFSSAQLAIQRVILQCSTVPDAISAVDFALSRGMELDLSSYSALIRKLVGAGEPHMAEVLYFENLVSRGINAGPSLLNSMVICYCKLGKLEEAKSHFDKLFEINSVPCKGACKSLLREFCMQDSHLEAFDYFIRINDAGVLLGFWCYNMLTDGLCFRGYLDEARCVLDVMRERGVPLNFNSCKSLVLGFCKRSQVVEAELFSMEMESHGFVLDKVLHTSIIHEYCKQRKLKMAMRVFFRMLKMGSEPDTYTYNTLIHGFATLGLFDKGGWFLHNKMAESALEPDVVTYQIIISNYCKEHKVDCALTVFESMRRRNITPTIHCYTVLIAALYKENRLVEINELYGKMLEEGVVPDHVLFFTFIKNYPKGRELHLALMILRAVARNGCGIDLSAYTAKTSTNVEEEIEHLLGEILRTGSHLADIGFSIYITALCMGGKIDSALLCLEKMEDHGCQPLLSACNSLMMCLCKEGRTEDARSLIELMQDKGMVPNLATYLIMVNEYCKRDDLASAFDVLDQMDEKGLKPSVAIYDSVISCLSKHKRISEAHNIFKTMLKAGIDPDNIFYITMINAYSKNGHAIAARQLFEKMMEHGVRPSSHAYTALISGLVKKNMIEKSCLYLDRMLEDGFVPNMVLYTSLIKQFLRKGEFEFARRLVDLMERSKIKGDLITDITLVSGVCRNVRGAGGRWHVAHKKSEKAREMLFDLLQQKSLAPRRKDLIKSINSREEIKLIAFNLIQELKDSSFMPNLYLYNSMIAGFCWADKMQDAYTHFDHMQKYGVPPNSVTYTILINGHVRFGEIDQAVELFNTMNANACSPDRIVYNTLIKGLCKSGRLLDALSLSYTMRKRGYSPCKASYEKLLSGLCLSRMSLYASRMFEDMLAHNYLPCRYNLSWLLCMLCEENNLHDAQAIHTLLLEKGKFFDETSRWLFLEARRKENELGLVS